MKNLGIIFIMLTGLILISCGYMFREVVTTNSCQSCYVVHETTLDTVWSEEDCGGGVHRMEDRCKIAAYDFGCEYKCTCETYKQDPEE